MLFLRSLWKTKYYFLAATAILLLTTQIWNAKWILTEPGQTCFFSTAEAIVPFIVLLPVSFLLYDNYEIELALINGVTTLRLMLYKFFATVIATLLPLLAVTLALREKYYLIPEFVTIPIEGGVPERYRLYFLISGFVTVVFFASLFLFLRVVLRNCYAPVGLGILVYSLFQTRNTDIHNLTLPFKSALFDPFITRYLIGDKIANEGFTSTMTGEVVAPFPHLWTFNRLLFFGLAVVLLAVTCILLRREKLHESFGD